MDLSGIASVSLDHAHDGTPLLELGYAYDAVGRLASRTDDQGTATFGYDDLHRLTSADFPGAGDYAYGYDPAGNVTSVTGPAGTDTRTHDAADRVADPGLAYDDAGALLTDGTRTFAYDALGRLTGVTGVPCPRRRRPGPGAQRVRALAQPHEPSHPERPRATRNHSH